MRNVQELAAALQETEKTAAHTSSILRRLSQLGQNAPKDPAALSKKIKGLGKYLLAGLALSGGGALAAGWSDAADRAWTRRKGFQNMLKENPDLAGKDDELKPLFRTMVNFSPQVAKDPLASGSMIRRMHDFRSVGVPLADIGTLAKIEKDVQSNRGRGPSGAKGADKILQSLFLAQAER